MSNFILIIKQAIYRYVTNLKKIKLDVIVYYFVLYKYKSTKLSATFNYYLR